MHIAARIGVALILASCSGAAPGSHAPLVPDVTKVKLDPNLAPEKRLGDATVPTAYHLKLDLDSQEGSFRGESTIDIEVRESVHTIWLHSKDLQIDSATLEQAGQIRPLAQVSNEGDSELLGLAAQSPIALGRAQLHIKWKGQFGTIQGLFRQTERKRGYIYSDFEATDARAAFPCYDDPRFKVPWTVALRVPSKHRAFSNAPQVSRTPLAGGHAVVRFATTRPLPSYLVAVAAGPFDTIEGKASKTPLRIIAPKGQAENGRFVLESTGTMLRYLEQYLDMPTPFRKLDFIAVPRFGGAMENPGLITFSSGILLIGNTPDPAAKRRALGVTAHELAHLWFGDLITPEYWHDLWLNEAFATWLSDKAVAHAQPARALEVLDIADKSAAFPDDYGLESRRVREPINNRDDIRAAFDRITYRKGGALLTMLEGWLGPKRMRHAVRAYLRAGDGGSVTSEALVASMVKSSGEPAVEPFFESFLTQTGIPQVHTSLRCDGAPTVTLRQSRYLPLNARPMQRDEDRNRQWQLPVCLRYPGDEGRLVRQCELLDGPSHEARLRTKSCPAWILPNDADTGYYHYMLSPDAYGALPIDSLSPRETLGLAYSVVAAMHSGELDVGQSLLLLERFADSDSAKVHQVVFDALYDLAESVITEEQRPAFAAMVRSWYEPLIKRVGVAPQAQEKPWMPEVRPALTLLLADLGEHSTLRNDVRQRVLAWLDSPSDIDFSLLDSWLRSAAIGGDKALSLRYRGVARNTREGVHRILLLSALYGFRDPTLLGELLKRGPRPPTIWPILAESMRFPTLRRRILESLDSTSLEPEELASLFGSMCDSDSLIAVRELVVDKKRLAELLQPIRGCMAFAEVQAESAAKHFANP